MLKTMLIYHSDCPDGFGAAFAFYQKFGNEIEYCPMNHNQNFNLDVTDKDIYMADIAFERSLILDIKSKAKSLVILDHHISDYEGLKDLDCYNFSSEHSGAMMAWEYLFPNQLPPAILKYVEDRDLYKWQYSNTREILSVVDSYPYSFEEWNLLNKNIEQNLEEMLSQGRAIIRYCDNLIKKMLRSVHKTIIAGYKVPIINISFFKPEIANQLSLNNPFAAAYHFDGKKYWVSLRASDESDIDVSKIAMKFGGGGHKRAAAFCVNSLDVLDIKNE